MDEQGGGHFDHDEAGLPLRNRRLLQFLSARVSSALAYQMLAVAVGWQIYALTGSPFFLGLVGLAQFLPMFLLSLVVGHVADRYDRRSILRGSQFIEGAAALALAAGSYSGWLGKEGILAAVLILGAARAFEAPTSQALMPGLVRGELFPRAVALATSLSQTSFIVGPALGGLLYAAGATLVYSIIGCLFLGSGLLVSLIRLERRPVKP
ncbi:MAG: MFS transporter, partial [Syntrophorhabdales bacterium]